MLKASKNLIGDQISEQILIAANKGFNKYRGRKMTQAKAAVFETDVMLFPIKPEAKEVSSADEKIEVAEVKKTTLRIDIRHRFERLKKGTRKRSASIF